MAKINQRLEINQKLNPKQILEASLFQLNSFALEQRIFSELEKNPLLEISDSEVVSEEETKEDLDDFEIEELYSNTDDFEINNTVSSKQEIIESSAEDKKNQSDFIKSQIKDINLNEIDEKIAFDIIDNLDHKGYMGIESILIADRFDVDIDRVSEIRSKIRQLDPPGLASVDIRECLLSQLEYHNYRKSTAFNIIHDCFENFSKADYEKISAKLFISKKEIKKALEILATLYLYPADNTEITAKQTILPDLSMDKRNDKWIIAVNDVNTPELVLNNRYSKMLEDKKVDRKARSFIKKNYDNALFFISAIQQRKVTMIKVMQSIVNRQKSYFDTDQKILNPMILKDVAEDINMDISTISRICNGKYVQLPWGIYELRFFFSEGISMLNGDVVSSSLLKKDIVNIIHKEDGKNPLRDEDIADMLRDIGYKIARRTVSKYREKLSIPSSIIRKRIKGLNQ